MADKRGGSRVPNNPASYSGVGKNSRRTDGQPVRAPHVQEGTDLTQGDRRVIEAAQRAAPLGQSSPQMPATSSRSMSVAGGGATAELPEHVLSLPSTRPGEPITEGLPFGEGAGPEVLATSQAPTEKELLARWAARIPDASRDWLRRIMDDQRPPEPGPTAVPTPLSLEEPEDEELT